MQISRLLIVSAVLLVGIFMFYRFSPNMSKLQINRPEAHFPIVTGYNLERKELEFPRDFAGDLNLVIVAFQRYHQDSVDTWVPTAKQIEAQYPGFIYYELPTLNAMSTMYRTFLNEGMRAGIPDATARQRTITLYLDKQRFRDALEIPSEQEIHLFLVNPQGDILWREVGGYTPEKAESLLNSLAELNANQ